MLPAVNCSLEGAQAGSGQLLCWACRGKVSGPSQICLEQLPQHRHTTRSPTQISWIKPLYFIFLSVVWCWTWAPVKCPLCPTMLQCWAGWKHQSNMNGCLGQLYPCLTQPLILETCLHFILKGKDRQSQCQSTAPLFLWLMVWTVRARVCFLPSPYKACFH